MIALSIRQPWADLIAQGIKTVEVRTWRTHHRGDILIVASASPIVDFVDEHGQEHRLPAGAHICIANLVDCRPFARGDVAAAAMEPEDWVSGLYAWHLDNIRPVANTRQRGNSSLYHVPDATILTL